MKLCLIGSTRFVKEYQETNEMLTKAGHIVYSICMASTGKPEDRNITEDEKETLDLVHLIKILNSDACILITDATGYVGYSTKREIKWAMMIGKQVVLPNQIVSFGENLKKFYETWLPNALDERSGIDLHSKIKI
jgi:hypothetical protein